MPVTCGTRLERLEALARQVQVEIELERRAQRENRAGAVEPSPRPLGRPARVRRVTVALSREEIADIVRSLGVSPAEIRAWARLNGHNPAVRGSLPAEIVEAYRDAFGPLITEGQAS